MVVKVERTKPQWHICPICNERFLSTANLGSHKFWKHEYLLFKAKRLEEEARGEPQINLRGIGAPSGRKRPRGPAPGIARIVKKGRQLILLE